MNVPQQQVTKKITYNTNVTRKIAETFMMCVMEILSTT